ncbi:MAG: tryptophan synthase subunit alpha [Chloroherpetonaceae bacterium]|nr:tryptophan synthase subunit alpha [Chthonomonadaceae bacterium]MDW8208508.1 tryptophan synthase subunit alpha [Chloroherpetonaceae bacterium]
MTRLDERFRALRASNEKALICFVTAGDPSPKATVEIIATLAKAGVDAVEIGIPFSDPLADGPSIQASSQRALQAGMTVSRALETIAQARRSVPPHFPIVVMTYYNPILRYGLERYAADAKAVGVDGHIVTDLTPEEADEWKRLSEANGLDTIFLLAPTSTPQRIEIVTRLSTGFVYCVSRTGVTGARNEVPAELTEVVTRIKSCTDLPVCVGFGVSAPEHVRQIAAFADGVVVGSRLVDLIHKHRDEPHLCAVVHDFTSKLKAATRG